MGQVCVTGLVGVVVSGASLPVRTRVSSLLPSLVGLISKTENGVGEAVTRAIGHLCSVCLSSNDVEGILNCGIVEGLCSQCMKLISSSNGTENWKIRTEPLLGGLDTLCFGLSEFISSEKEKRQTTCERKEGILEDRAESEFSVLNRCSSALSLIEATLNEMLTVLQGTKKTGEEQIWTRQIHKQIGGMLLYHFPHSITDRTKKRGGMIGLDIGKERQKMEEQMKMKLEDMEAERQREWDDIKQKRIETETERATNQHLIEQGKKWIEQEQRLQAEENQRRLQSRTGAKVIELFDLRFWTVSGNVFTKSHQAYTSLVSYEFGAVVVRLSLTVRTVPSGYFTVGIISSGSITKQINRYYPDWMGGAGWDLYSNYRYARQNKKDANVRSACLVGKEGQRVVLEADGREGKRTLKLSQAGETQPVFFKNIPVPFRFAVHIYQSGDAVEIESVEVVVEPQMEGGSISFKMDE
ncbi:hypothetical protein BLNAU_4290 [Blattamonas nauphoetae]|uniref:Uncharacterized protein n=1 Tax=Blattamonas nauphoetae TaxID=2049346 RepID=A0ABQ9YAB1_9EUKA|nr:hypothetical protein BLNAU_4290 [Blattamonas nauphoetae]